LRRLVAAAEERQPGIARWASTLLLQ